jgi:hypothetical protein
MHDWQQIAAMAIVAGAMLGVGRRLWGQVGAFRAKPGKVSGSGCDGCASNKTDGGGKAQAAPALVQIQTRPPAHLRRPPAK